MYICTYMVNCILGGFKFTVWCGCVRRYFWMGKYQKKAIPECLRTLVKYDANIFNYLAASQWMNLDFLYIFVFLAIIQHKMLYCWDNQSNCIFMRVFFIFIKFSKLHIMLCLVFMQVRFLIINTLNFQILHEFESR